MTAKSSAGDHKVVSDGEQSPKKLQESNSSSAYPNGGGPHTGLTHILWEIDPDTLPEDGCWKEVARRVQAFEEGRDGWRTGEIDTSLDDYRGGSP